jgi:hypothetical protein
MRSRLFWAVMLAAVVAFVVAACSKSPGAAAVDHGMTWDQSPWDSSNWN